jgi:hypothetical protein
MLFKTFFKKAAALLVGAFLVSLLVDNLAMDLRIWLQTRGAGVYGPLAAYYLVHYVVFQVTLIMLVYIVLHGERLSWLDEALCVVVITAGKLLGRVGYETSATIPQLMFSLLISTQLSMAAVLIGYRLPSINPARQGVKINDLSLETYASLAIILWFALMPGVDMLGSDTYSNLLRIAMALSLLFVGFLFFRDSWVEGWTIKIATLVAFCIVGLLVANIFAGVIWNTQTIMSVQFNENIAYVAALAFQGFFLSLTTVSGIWLKTFRVKVQWLKPQI